MVASVEGLALLPADREWPLLVEARKYSRQLCGWARGWLAGATWTIGLGR